MDMQDTIDQEILKRMFDLRWKQCHRFSEKWNFGAITITVLETARAKLERDFRAAYPDLDFDREWSKCFDEVTDSGFDPLVGTMRRAARMAQISSEEKSLQRRDRHLTITKGSVTLTR